MEKRVYVDMNGRLGNQFFQYALARKLSLITKFKIVIDYHNVYEKGHKLRCENSFVDYLEDFNVTKYTPVDENGFQIKIKGSKRQKKLLKFYYFIRKLENHFPILKLLQKFQYKMQKNGIYKEDECNINIYDRYDSNIFLKGYFEDPSIFEDIRGELLEEFTPKKPPSSSNKHLYDIINSSNSVCVSFRSWEEIKDNEELYKNRNVCTKEYYDKALDKMHEIYPDAIFIIFSDNIEFVKKNFMFKYPVYFESGKDPVYEKLRLMYSCKHFIMSTSTFAWWAQYLSRNKNKTVISPDRWYSNGNQSKLLLNNWFKIITKY